VLVADAGTCLSLTCVDGQGRFCGGRLSAGLALQLRSLGEGTAQLPQVLHPQAEPMQCHAAWPLETAAAMVEGCLSACAAAVAQAWRDRGEAGGSWALWLTGGDAALLEPLLRQQGVQAVLAPDLALEALAELTQPAGLSSGPGR
jgi:type III pantothenate kinase